MTRPNFWTATQGFASKGSHIFTKESPYVALCGHEVDLSVELRMLGVKVPSLCDECNERLAIKLQAEMLHDIATMTIPDDEEDIEKSTAH